MTALDKDCRGRHTGAMNATEVRTPNAKVGDGATIQVGSDCYPATVIAVSPSGKKITLQMDSVSRNQKVWPEQEYDCTPNPNGGTRAAYWSPKYRRYFASGTSVSIGTRRYYQDPSF